MYIFELLLANSLANTSACFLSKANCGKHVHLLPLHDALFKLDATQATCHCLNDVCHSFGWGSALLTCCCSKCFIRGRHTEIHIYHRGQSTVGRQTVELGRAGLGHRPLLQHATKCTKARSSDCGTNHSDICLPNNLPCSMRCSTLLSLHCPNTR